MLPHFLFIMLMLFLKTDGSAWAFGLMGNRLGDGSWSARYNPVRIIDENVTAVFAGDGNSYFLKRIILSGVLDLTVLEL